MKQYSITNKEYNREIYDGVMDTRSIYIPHVFDEISKETVVEVLQDRYNLGTIKKIECIPKINQTDGHKYYCCYVFLQSWSNDSNATYLLSRLEKQLVTRLKYSGEKYWQICLNTSEIAFYENPKHYDLVLYLHPDFKEETILAVVEGLDIGKVNSIEILQTDDIQDKYQDKTMWEYANPAMWRTKNDVKYNIVKIRFDYWFRTKTTYYFQDSIHCKHFIDIPIFQGTFWTFFYEKPKFEGANPFVWIAK